MALTSLLPDVLIGDQRPRLASLPQGVSSDGELAVELAARCGLFLDPWQAFSLDQLLQKRADGRWVTRTGLLVVPRQNGKGCVDEAWELHRLFLKHSAIVLHTAHHAKTAKGAFDKMRALIEGSPLLRKRLADDRSGGIRTANGEWGFTFKTGQRLIYGTRTSGAGRGLTIDDTVLDEFQELTDAEFEALKPTMTTLPDSQTLMTGSAPKPGAEVAPRLMKRGREGDPSLTYLEWSIDESADVDLDDRQTWARANPGYGIRLDYEAIVDERSTMSDEGFARERLGIVVTGSSGLFPAGAWERLTDPASKVTGPVMFAVDVAEDRSRACIAVAGQGADAKHVGVVDYRPQTDWIVSRCRELAAERSEAAFVLRPDAAAGALLGDLENAGLTVVKAPRQSYAQACGDFYDAVVGSELRHVGQPELNVSVAGARKRASGDAFVWDQRNSAIMPLAAVTLALWGHVARLKVRRGRFLAI
jgi:phage terminase large subunit-like protein